jgi:immune inhibitor A
MYDFYKENSYGKLDLKGEVVGWLRLPQPYSYYVNGNNGGGDYPTNAQKMVEDALTLAVKKVNLKDFDDDKDGYLDGLFVVHAGGGAEAEPDAAARAKKIWSHQWSLPKPFVQNGVRVFAYCTEPEDGRAGVFCHEFGHMLGLPDLYDTTYQSEGVGVWCLMAAGSWNNGGQTPAQFCAWAKTRLGWIRPAIVRKNQSLKLAAIEDDPKAVYRIWNKGRSGAEYFLVENRQLRGFDAKLPASGLLVWHVDDTQHNNDHAGKYWVALEQADGKNDLETGRNRGDKGDPYPGDAGNTKFDGKSAPSSSDNLNRPTGVSISGVTVDKGVVKCRVNV